MHDKNKYCLSLVMTTAMHYRKDLHSNHYFQHTTCLGICIVFGACTVFFGTYSFLLQLPL